MVNLLKFKDQAEYPDGRETDLTGEQAYAIYSEAVSKLLLEFGGAPMFGASVERLMLGQVEELWDMVAIAMYPCPSSLCKTPSSQPPQLSRIPMVQPTHARNRDDPPILTQFDCPFIRSVLF